VFLLELIVTPLGDTLHVEGRSCPADHLHQTRCSSSSRGKVIPLRPGLPIVRGNLETTFEDKRLALLVGEAIGLAAPGAERFLIPGDRMDEKLRP
jgi:hypothetical protein